MFDFIPVVSERMALASMSDPNTYLGGDTALLTRPFRKETWLAIMLMIIFLMAATKLFTFELKITKKTFDFSSKIRNIPQRILISLKDWISKIIFKNRNKSQ